jgi:hypothetical protein
MVSNIIAIEICNDYTKGKYISKTDGKCKSVIFPDDGFIEGNTYTTDGVNIFIDKKIQTSNSSKQITTINFVIKLISILNPFCKIDNYKSGGMIKYGTDLYILEETPDKNRATVLNFTTNTKSTLQIYDTGYYIIPFVATCYLFLWNIFAMIFGKYYEKHKIHKYSPSVELTLNVLSGDSQIEDYTFIVSLIETMQKNMKTGGEVINPETFINLLKSGDKQGALTNLKSQINIDDEVTNENITILDKFLSARSLPESPLGIFSKMPSIAE